MSITSYATLQTALTSWLGNSLNSASYPDFIALFEAAVNRKLRVRQMEATTILVPSSPAAITITGAANNGSGLIRLTITSSSTYATGNELNVANVGGTTEANGTWIVTVIDATHVDLQGSTFTHTYVSGGTIKAQSGFVTLPTDYLAWRRVTWTGSIRNELEYVHPSYFQAAFPSQTTDVPRFFTIEGTTLKVMPLDATGLEFDYFQKVPPLATTDPNWLLTAHPDLYLFGSLCEAELFAVNDERAPLWKARRDEIFDEISRLNHQTRGPSAIRVMGVTP